MKRRSILFLTLASIATVAGAVFGVRYMVGSWAPTTFEGGLRFNEVPELRVSSGEMLPPDGVKEFVRICSALHSTTRDIGEDRGSGFIRIHYPTARDHDFLTVYSDMNVVFRGWWIDAKTYSMMDQRAPCYELTPELNQFMQKHKLLTTNAEQGADGSPH